MKKVGITVLTILVLSSIIFLSKQKVDPMSEIKISWYASNKLELHDTANIQFAAPAMFLLNIYTTLMVYNNKSELDFGLAESFNWVSESEIEFKIRNNLFSSKGDSITVKDVYLTFMRLIVKQTNTHGQLQNFLCPNTTVKSVNDACPGIKYEGNSLFLRAADKNMAKFLLPLIASCDFGIIPQSAIDWNSDDLKIIDYSNTTGPFFVDSTNENNEHLLKANKHSPLYSENMPQVVRLMPVLDTSSPQKLKEKKIDVITTVDRASTDDLSFFDDNNDYSIHKTSDLRVTLLQFTSEGKNKLSESERLALGNVIRKVLLNKRPNGSVVKDTAQFFPTFGESSLTDMQLQELSKLSDGVGQTVTSKKIRISVESFKLDFFKEIFSDYKNLEFIKFSGMPASKKIKDMEDAFILPGDTGFYENIALISYYMSSGSFGYNKSEANIWIQDYIKTENKSERLGKLKKLHFDILAKGLIIPISIVPYIAVSTNEWKLDFYKHFAGTPLWMMQKN